MELANRYEVIRGVVGWVDLLSPEVEEQLHWFAEHPKFVGVRHVVQDEQDDRFLMGAEFRRGLRFLKGVGLRYDLLIYPRQLPAAVELVEEMPGLPFVLDHCAKPAIAQGELAPWALQLKRLASFPNVTCKVSGLVTEANWAGWSLKDLLPYLEVVLEAFGPERLMWGSDWPVCLHASSYARWWEVSQEWTQSWSVPQREAFFGGTCAAFYGVE
ncbi:MAG: amidohydrolase [Verrucomicrobia bacterium]|nr:amidohydrolase [Verrucomicrobiota bacterium]